MNTMRIVNRIAAVGVVALVLAGSAASVEARPRSDVVRMANAGIGACFRAGGEANVVDLGVYNGSGMMDFACTYPDGTIYNTVLIYDE